MRAGAGPDQAEAASATEGGFSGLLGRDQDGQLLLLLQSQAGTSETG